MGDPAVPSAAYRWDEWIRGIYKSGKGPEPLGTVSFDELEARAKEKLKDDPEAYEYAYGNAGTGATYHANRKAFDKYRIVPRMLVNATTRNIETTIFGVKYSSPVFIAPIGVQGIFHPDGELAAARAGKALGVPFIMSTASSRSIEAVAEANGDGHRWCQLYWPKDDKVTLSLLSRAKANGFSALVVTLDTMEVGWRAHDLATAYIPFGYGVGIEVGRSDPVFMAKHGMEPVKDHRLSYPFEMRKRRDQALAGDEEARRDVLLGREWLAEANSGTFRSWEDLKLLRDNWKGPLVLKGIQSSSDALKCLEHGVDGIIVSNHGGRQVDGAIPSLYALAQIMSNPRIQSAQASGELTVLFDSGLRNGSDIIKAIALGAQAVLLGRPWVYGLMLGGQAGVEQVLKHTIADLDVTLGLAGWKSLRDLHLKGNYMLTKVDW